MTIFIVYPDERFVPDETIKTWFLDAIANREIPPEALTNDVEAMADALSDVGHITRAIPPANWKKEPNSDVELS